MRSESNIDMILATERGKEGRDQLAQEAHEAFQAWLAASQKWLSYRRVVRDQEGPADATARARMVKLERRVEKAADVFQAAQSAAITGNK